jgi:hypothetical protein
VSADFCAAFILNRLSIYLITPTNTSFFVLQREDIGF